MFEGKIPSHLIEPCSGRIVLQCNVIWKLQLHISLLLMSQTEKC